MVLMMTHILIGGGVSLWDEYTRGLLKNCWKR